MRTDGRTDRQTDITLRVAFHNFANVPTMAETHTIYLYMQQIPEWRSAVTLLRAVSLTTGCTVQTEVRNSEPCEARSKRFAVSFFL